jgi:hypothetical protein
VCMRRRGGEGEKQWSETTAQDGTMGKEERKRRGRQWKGGREQA